MSGAQPLLNRPFPYIRWVRIDETSLTLITTIDLFTTVFAAVYPAVAPNVRGALGLFLPTGGGAFFPTHVVCISDDVSALECAVSRANVGGVPQVLKPWSF